MSRAIIYSIDREFAKMIVARDGRRCVICGSADSPECGHLLPRYAMSTRWNEKNCNCQCHECNRRHETDPRPYVEWFIRRYGKDEYDRLVRSHNSVVHYTTEELKDKLEEIREKRRKIFS